MKNLTTKQLFLIDGSGALISAILLGFVLPEMNALIGMPLPTLYRLAVMAGIFAMYSWLCFLLPIQNRKPFLKGIGIVNLCYCVLTLGLMIQYRSLLTWLDYTYFLGEILIVIGLATFELRMAFEKL